MADTSAAASKDNSNGKNNDTVVLLFYKYVALSQEEVATLCEWMLTQGARFGLTGRVLLAVEGINANVAGSSAAIRSFCNGVTAHAILQKEGSGKIDLKLDSVPDKTPHQLFPDFKVQQKKEICSTGNRMPFELLGAGMGGQHLDPKEFHAVLQEYWTGDSAAAPGASVRGIDEENKKKELVVIDVRNRKEYDVGRFEHVDAATGETRSAVDPNTKLFNDWAAQFAEKEAPLLRDKKVLMYCTGGIRCEKASAYLRSLGVSDVSQLKGGIHRYIEEFGNGGFFKGKNYIFDSRGLQDPISLKQQQLARDTNTGTGTPTPTPPTVASSADTAAFSAGSNTSDDTARSGDLTDVGATDKQTSGNATQVIGKCFSCGVPEEQVTCDRVCAVCRDGILVCDTCRQARRGFYYCRDHMDLEGSYAPHLDNFSAVQTPDELNRQINELEVLRKSPKYLGKPNYNRRRTVAKQVGRLSKLIIKLEKDTPPETAQKTHDENVGRRMCVHGKVFTNLSGGQPDDSAAKGNVISREGCVPRCRCCGKFGPKDLLEKLWGDRPACGCQPERTPVEGASASLAVDEKVHEVCLGESGVFVITRGNNDNDDDDVDDDTSNSVAGIKRPNSAGGKGREGGGGKKKKPALLQKKIEKFKKQKPSNVYDETEYEINTESTGGTEAVTLRKVVPYVMEYETRAKGRWLGRTVQEMFLNEFGANSPAYYANCIRNGLITVNNAKVPDNGEYIIQDGDLIVHATHRHEPPVLHVTASDMVAHENETILVANKPASVPVHPCGAYRYNSLTVILAKEWPSATHLKTIHRLDRLTSGIVILAKSREAAQRLSVQMKAKSDRGAIAKVYVAKVHGRFPANAKEYESHPDQHEPRLTTVLQAHPEFGKPASALSVNMERKVPSPGVTWGKQMILGVDAGVATAAGLGDEMSPNDLDVVTLSCPLRCRSHKHGVWECSLVPDEKTGGIREGEKPSVSRFKLLRYDEASNTSIVQAKPVTGRTHQLRLHLQIMGFPILNDPNYGGAHVVHGGDEVKPEATDDVKKVLPKSEGMEVDSGVGSKSDEDVMTMDESLSLKERVSLLCLHCNDKDKNQDAPFSHDQLRHHGLCLHAHRYACMQDQKEPETDLWDWAVPLPKWAHYDS